MLADSEVALPLRTEWGQGAGEEVRPGLPQREATSAQTAAGLLPTGQAGPGRLASEDQDAGRAHCLVKTEGTAAGLANSYLQPV